MNAKRKIDEAEEEDYRPSEVEFLAGLVSKTATIQEKSAAFAVSARLPSHEYFKVKALAQRSGKSVNTIFVHLVRSGLEALHAKLPASDMREIYTEANRLHWEARNQDTGSPNYETSDGEQAA